MPLQRHRSTYTSIRWTHQPNTWLFNQILLGVRDGAASVPRQMWRPSTSCLRSAGLPAESAAVSAKPSPRQSDAGQRMIRCCLTCAQYGTCVYSVGMITGLGHPPNPVQLQRHRGRSALCLFAGKIGSWRISFWVCFTCESTLRPSAGVSVHAHQSGLSVSLFLAYVDAAEPETLLWRVAESLISPRG